MADTWTAMVTALAVSKGDQMPEDVQVSVDRDFARFGGKSYAINKINTVEVRQRHPNGKTGMFVAGLIALFCLLAAFGEDGVVRGWRSG
jgi:hypothetical protein